MLAAFPIICMPIYANTLGKLAVSPSYRIDGIDYVVPDQDLTSLTASLVAAVESSS